jgi:hypothetical protein
MRAVGVGLFVALVVVVGSAPAGAKDLPGPTGKLDTHVRDLVLAQQQSQSVQALGHQDRLTVNDDRVLVDVYVNGDVGTAAQALADAGMDVQGQSDAGPVPMVEGYLPVSRADAVARLGVTQAVSAITAKGTDDSPATGGTDVGAVTSAGDAAHNGPQARALGVNGAGVKVGVMSDSINEVGGGVAASQATGDLPANVQVLADSANGEDEGRAMAEIIYDEAPGVTNMAFATGTQGPVGKANDIAALKNANVQVLADDTFYLQEPFFQDGAVAQAVDTAKAAGVAYFASAGNRARQSWEGTYVNAGDGFNNFGGGDEVQSVAQVQPGGFIEIVLQWDEPFGHASTDMDALLVDMSDLSALASSVDDNINGTHNPIETLVYSNNTGFTQSVGLAISRFAGTRNPFMKWIGFGGNYNVEHATNSDTIDPDAASALGSFTVAAINAGDAGHNDPEPFSSRGLKTRLFDKNGNPLPLAQQTRQKPQLAGADGVNTTVPGFAPFFGTSAAAPSAAGVATLVKSANPSLTVDQLGTIMTNPANTIDCTLAGNPDADCGFGFILADRAVQQALGAAAPTITSFTPTSGRTGAQVTINGTDFTGATAVKFNGLAAPSSTVVSSTKITARVPDAATTGKIAVTTPKGTATSAGSYTVTFRIASLSPTSGPTNTVVRITGVGFNSGSAVKFNGVSASKTFVSPTTLKATVPASATSGKVTVTNTTGVTGTVTSPTNFAVTAFIAPTVSSFTPTISRTGQTVTITGTHFSGASDVRFNGKSSPAITLVSDTTLKAVVPNGATTGSIAVTTAAGTGKSASSFTVKFSITGFFPASGPAGTTVTINGVGFTSGSVVKFNGVPATKTFVSSTKLTATVPASATTGKITVTNAAAPSGTVTSAAVFTKT